MSTEEAKAEEIKKEEVKDEEKKEEDWNEAASDSEEEEAKEEKKEEPKKPKPVYQKDKHGEILITKLDDYVEPPKEVKEAKGDIRDANKYDFKALVDSEEEEEDESHAGEGKKRTASTHLEAKSPQRGKAPLPEESTAAADSGPAWDPRAQPLVNS